MSLQPKDWNVDYFLKNESECVKLLENIDAVRDIPSLNSISLDNFKDGQLVRFQGMLQDMYNPEYFLKKYQVVNKQTGGSSIKNGMLIDGAWCQVHNMKTFFEAANFILDRINYGLRSTNNPRYIIDVQPHEVVEVDSDQNESSQRHTWIVISTPGLNDWCKEISDIKMPMDMQCEKLNANKSNKRSLDETEEQMDCSESHHKKEKVSNNSVEATSSNSKGLEVPQVVSKEHILNFPIPNKDGKACIVKVYQDLPYKLNQVIDIIGFLSLNPCLSESYDSGEIDQETVLERQTHNPPASIVPRLHAIKISDEKSLYTLEPASIFSKAESIRGDLRMVLSQLLFGDEIAAEYLICHLISSVYLRKDMITLGAFPINITNFPKQFENFSKDLYEILKEIVEKSHLIDLTLENLNEMCLLPKKDYDCDRLTSGILQLSKNTHLIIDETNLKTGQVTACGKQNYSTMNDLIVFQKLPYDFKFYTMEYETDIPVLILSELKSFIPCQTQILLKPDPETVKLYPQVLEAARQYLKNEARLTSIRQYINTLKQATFEFTDEISNIIQEDFVKLRQSYKTFDANHLHSLMVFSRLMSLSYGVNTLKLEMWKRCFDMEMERLSRLPVRD